jgi:hypothetical protein
MAMARVSWVKGGLPIQYVRDDAKRLSVDDVAKAPREEGATELSHEVTRSVSQPLTDLGDRVDRAASRTSQGDVILKRLDGQFRAAQSCIAACHSIMTICHKPTRSREALAAVIERNCSDAAADQMPIHVECRLNPT